MSDDIFSLGYWLTEAAASAPLLVMLVVGLVICHRQRQRRPRVAKLLGWVLLAELIWVAVGRQLFLFAYVARQGSSAFSLADSDGTSWMTRLILWRLPGSTVNASIWGTVLWAVLVMDDRPDESTEI